jgi:PAS domain S-box-containing protein
MGSEPFRRPEKIASLDSPFYTVIFVCLVAVLSYLVAMLGGILVLRPQMVWPLWPGCAFLVAVLLLTPRKIWPSLIAAGMAGFVLYDLRAGLTIRSTFLLIVADTVEVLIAALGVTYTFGGTPHLNSVRSLAKYLFFAVILAPISVASVGAIALGGDYWVTWRISFLTEALALLTLTPAILSWVTPLSSARKSRAYYLEAAVLLLGLVVLAYIAFVVSNRNSPAILYSLVPFLLWSALRFGTMGIASAMIVVSFLSIWGAVHGRGPFTGLAPLSNVLSLQLFLLFTAIPFMVLAALIEERSQVEATLKKSEEKFSAAFRESPMVLTLTTAKDLRYLDVNETFERVTGWRRDEVIGRTPLDINVWADPDQRLAVTKQVLARGLIRDVEFRVRRKDGAERVGLCSAELIEIAGETCVISVIADITGRKIAEEALTTLSGRLIEAQEEERRRIAREIHDDYQQRLAMLAIDLEELEAQIDNSTVDVSKRLRELWNHVSELGADLHALSHSLHSSTLERLGLVAGVKAFCEEFSDQQEIRVDFAHENIPHSIPGDVALCLFRIMQEGIRNVKRHSGTDEAEVRLEGLGEKLHLSVSDRGRGFDCNGGPRSGGIGIRSMEERLRLLGGYLEIHSRPLEGTRIDAWLPFKVVSERAG